MAREAETVPLPLNDKSQHDKSQFLVDSYENVLAINVREAKTIPKSETRCK